MTTERLAVAANTETLAAPGDDDGSYDVIVVCLFKQVSILGVQPARPSIHALRPIEPNDCDALGVDFVLRVLQFHIYSVCAGAALAADIQIGLLADTVVAANVLQKPHVRIVDALG